MSGAGQHALAEQAGAPYRRRLALTTLLPVLVERADLGAAARELQRLKVGVEYAGLMITLGGLRLAPRTAGPRPARPSDPSSGQRGYRWHHHSFLRGRPPLRQTRSL